MHTLETMSINHTQPVPNPHELQQKLLFYENLLNKLLNDLVVFDTEHKYLYLNPTAVRDEETRNFLLHKTDFDYCAHKGLPTDMAQARHNRFLSVLKTGQSLTWKEEKLKDGYTEVIARTFVPIKNADGVIEMVLGYGLDVSKLHTTETELNRRLAEYEQILANTFIGIVITDSELNVIETNTTCTTVFNMPPAQLMGKCLLQLLMPHIYKGNRPAGFSCTVEISKQPFYNNKAQLDITTPGGKLLNLEVTTHKFNSYNTSKYVTFINDITEKVKSHSDMLVAASMPEENPNPVFRVSYDNHLITYANPPGKKLVAELPNGLKTFFAEMFNLIELSKVSGKTLTQEIQMNDKWYKFTLAPAKVLNYLNIYAVEITQLKKWQVELNNLNQNLQAEVQKQTKQLTESNQSLEQFAYSISHDLRAPLRQINGLASILKRHVQRSNYNETIPLADDIISTVQHLDSQITALLQLSKLDAEEIKFTAFDIKEVFTNAVKVYAEYYKCEVLFEYSAPAQACGDSRLMAVVIDNLVSNGIKYSVGQEETSRLTVTAWQTGNEITFCLRDNGCGFDMKNYEQIFGMFKRLHTHEYEGMGIGLAFSKKIIEKHKGKIWATSQPGKGTAFYFTLPAV